MSKEKSKKSGVKSAFSIRNRMLAIMLIVLLSVSLCLLFMSVYTGRKLRQEIVLSNLSILQQQTANLNARIRQDKNFLANLFSADLELYLLRQASEKKNWGNYIYQIKQDFVNSQAEGNMGEIYFLLLDDPLYSTYAYRGNYSGQTRLSVLSWLDEWVWQEQNTDMTEQFIEIGGAWYALMAFHDDKVCIGCLISADKLAEMVQMREDERTKVTLSDGGNKFITEQSWLDECGIVCKPANGDYYSAGTRERYIIIQHEMEQLPGSVFYVMADDAIMGNMKPIMWLTWAVAVFIFILAPISLAAMRRVLLVPLDRLKDTIHQIKTGGVDSRVEYPGASREMKEVYDLFNDMMAQIRQLKIRYYEEEIKKKDYQLQYFSLQVKPHFYMNSLKCLYALAQSQNHEKLQQMILTMSEYYKQITYDNQSMVTVAAELEHVSLYMEIRQVGVENKINCRLSMDNRARKVLLPVLSIQTYVENSIKYAMMPDRELVIDITVSVVEQNDQRWLDIMVTDNGPGYNREIIRAINQEHVDHINGHVGLTNLWNRLKIIYEGNAFMAISNLPEGGAYSEILLPWRAETSQKNKMGGKTDEYANRG